jgi:hypothetical protein
VAEPWATNAAGLARLCDHPPFTSMQVTAGSRLGPYEVVAPIGAGGMEEVYKARVTRDGQRFVVDQPVDNTTSTPLTFVSNWMGLRR